MSETEAIMEADVEGKDVDVCVSRYEPEGFTLSEIFSKRLLSMKILPEGVVNTSHLRQCKFSNH